MTYTWFGASSDCKRLHSIGSEQGFQSSSTRRLLGRLIPASAAILILMLVSVSSLPAQVAGFGTIQGTVSDPSGAVVAAAQVTATNAATGLKYSQQTSDAGTYAIVALPAGRYTVEVRGMGFGPVVHENVMVDALRQVGLNIELPLGSSTEKVVVSAEPPQLQTENGTVETTIPQTTYNALPVAMNNAQKSPIGFLTLVPGMGRDPLFGTPVVNGGFQESSQIYVNGLPLASPELQGGVENLGLTSTEMVDQFQVLTSGIPANYDGQGIVNLVLKSGTNHLHGSVYENIRNTAFDAKGFFTKGPTPVEHQNEYGFTVGGPVLHQRIFYFGSYDGYKISTGSSPQFVTIPTVAERTGDFSAFPVIYDPASTTCSEGICTRTAFPGNIIPANRISSVAKSLQSYLPAPQNTKIANNYFNTFTNGNTNRMYLANVDVNFTSSNRATFMFQKGANKSISLGGYLPEPYTDVTPGSSTQYAAQISDTQIITPHLLNIFGAQFMRTAVIVVNPTVSGDYTAKAGFTGLPSGPASHSFPRVVFNGPDAPYLWGGFGGGGFVWWSAHLQARGARNSKPVQRTWLQQHGDSGL